MSFLINIIRVKIINKYKEVTNMKRELFNFSVIPSVVPADKVSKISICGNGDYYRFFDDVQYTVKICPKEFHDVPMDKDFTLGK